MARRGWFFRIRVAVLGSILVMVALYAWKDQRDRKARTAWEKPLRVGLVFLRSGAVDEAALSALTARASALEQQLANEYRRYRPQESQRMVQLIAYGPVSVERAPSASSAEGLWAQIRDAYTLFRYTRDVDARADVPSRGLDSRIYVIAEPKTSEERAFVEGFSQSGGRIGVARVELAPDMVDFALFVTAHELFHTLGATDKYDASGRTRIPDGLPAPGQVPLFPQPGAEIMARNRMLDPENEVPPVSLDELRVGPLTAREIGWAP